jgi:hypothetical protein
MAALGTIAVLLGTARPHDSSSALFLCDPAWVPHELGSRFKQITVGRPLWLCIDGPTLRLLWHLKWRIAHPYFAVKLFTRVAQYAFWARRARPCTIVSAIEYSFVSSALTDYAHRAGFRHVNVMHGDKLTWRIDSFFCFDECFIWHEHYRGLFEDLLACPAQFVVAVPPAIQLKLGQRPIPASRRVLTYYLNLNDGDEAKLSALSDVLRRLAPSWHVRVRPHPRFGALSFARQVLGEHEWEDPGSVSLVESLTRTDLAVAICSTVLIQAHFAGREFAINDVSERGVYERLRDLGYVALSLPHRRLSALAGSVA